MASEAVLTQRLAEAEDALHRLQTGAAEVSIYYDGHRTEYSQAKLGDLVRYIGQLKDQLADARGEARPVRPRRSRRVQF